MQNGRKYVKHSPFSQNGGIQKDAYTFSYILKNNGKA